MSAKSRSLFSSSAAGASDSGAGEYARDKGELGGLDATSAAEAAPPFFARRLASYKTKWRVRQAFYQKHII